MKPKVEVCEDGKTWLFDCVGCKMSHSFYVCSDGPRGGWSFNGDVYKPTFSPSLLVKGTIPITDEEAAQIMRGEPFEPVDFLCHSFVTDGKIQYLSDCTHELAGQTIEMKDL